MPNHVYCNISVEEKYADKLKEIAKVGLAQYYKPRPKELEGTTAPARIGENITKEESDRLIELYGHNNWYDWSYQNWGTKWGCYDNEYEDGHYRFTTAWGPLDTEILDMLAKDIPDFLYDWEEEQGYGQEIEYTDGYESVVLEYDVPNWETTDNDEIYFLAEDYESPQGYFKSGYYIDGFLDSFLAETYEEALKEL
jgi:hypothetical protein